MATTLLSAGITMGSSTLQPGGSAPSYTCRAWVNFDGTTNVGGFCTIRASGNVSSVTDQGVGNFDVNFTTAMSDANYSVATTTNGSASGGVPYHGITFGGTISTTVIRVTCTNATAFVDNTILCAAIFR